MSEHHGFIQWRRTSDGFAYKHYNREHSWRFDEGVEVSASAAPEYLGKSEHVDPEQALVAAISSCHMLTFLALSSRKGIVVDGYQDRAVGFLEKNEKGRFAVTRVELRPQIEFGGEPPGARELQALHEAAHRGCFIANSVNCEIVVREPDA